MLKEVREFLKQHKDIIIDFDFRELYSKAKQQLTTIGMKEMWGVLKTINAPLSYKNILPKYTKYENLDDIQPSIKTLQNLNSLVEIKLPDMTYYEILKIIRELYPGYLSKSDYRKHIQKEENIPCHHCKLSIHPPIYPDIHSYCYLQLEFIPLGTTKSINKVILSTSFRILNYIPGLCIAYNKVNLKEYIKQEELDILSTLEEIREGKI